MYCSVFFFLCVRSTRCEKYLWVLGVTVKICV